MSTLKSRQNLKDKYSNEPVNSGSNSGKPSSSKFKTLTILIILVVIIVIFLVFMIQSIGKGGAENSPHGVDVNSDKTVESTAKDATSYTASMNSEWIFPDARSSSTNAFVANITDNSHTVYFVVKRNDTGAIIYESPDIPVGEQLVGFKLDDTSLTKGTYPCTVTYNLIDENRTQLSHVNISVSIIIQND